MTQLSFQRICCLLLIALAGRAVCRASDAGNFAVAYSVSGDGHTRAAAPSPTDLAGTASFGIIPAPNFLIAGSTQTFTSEVAPGSKRTWGYGVTKLEANRDWRITKKKDIHLEADYTIILPTNGNNTPGVEHYAHQFLGMLDDFHSPQNYFEVDVGDLMSGRAAAPGYKHTALLSLVAQHNLRRDGKSGTNLDFEVDASPSAEGAPASAVLTAGAEHTFKSKFTVTALALVGLTANDPAIGFAVKLKFTGSFAKEQPQARSALNFSKLQRLERMTFGKIGRF